ncbi:hypothetical protein ACFVAJ_18835 [Agromyces sp. NPDC057679]|uniref:hypothetical protein n=1 Tax=Agromyces sp. NPDC057679 TaxID=3346207 RepID=UPI0036733C3D
MATATFKTHDTSYRQYNGERVTVVSKLNPASYDADEVGPMYNIDFADGKPTEAFADELTDWDVNDSDSEDIRTAAAASAQLPRT